MILASLRNNIIRGLVGLIATIFCLCILELTLAIMGLDFREKQQVIRNQNDEKKRSIQMSANDMVALSKSVLHNLMDNELTYPDRELIYRVKPNFEGTMIHGYSGINADGFRGDRFDLSSKKKRIMLLGNSCVFGWEIMDLAKTFSSRLDVLLKSHDENYTIYNFGQPGYSTTQILRLYDQWKVKIKPDLIIIYAGWNDLWETPLLTDRQTMRLLKIQNNPIVKKLSRSRLYAMLNRVLKGTGFTSEPNTSQLSSYGKGQPRVPMEESIENFEKLIVENEKVWIILPPFCCHDRFLPLDQYKAELVRRFGNRATIITLSKMEKEASNAHEYFNEDGFHPNEEGTEYIANILADHIQGLEWNLRLQKD